MWRRSSFARHRQQAAERPAERRRVPDRAVDVLERPAAKADRQRRLAVADLRLVGEAILEVVGRPPVAARLEHPREQLLGGLARLELEQLVVLAGQHQPGLELEQGGDEHDELGRRLEIELAASLEEVEVGDDDLGQLELEQVDDVAQDERQQQVERAAEDLQIELELGQQHRGQG